MHDEVLNKIIKAKKERRRELAGLSIEEKIQILVEMQKISKNIKKLQLGSHGKPPRQ